MPHSSVQQIGTLRREASPVPANNKLNPLLTLPEVAPGKPRRVIATMLDVGGKAHQASLSSCVSPARYCCTQRRQKQKKKKGQKLRNRHWRGHAADTRWAAGMKLYMEMESGAARDEDNLKGGLGEDHGAVWEWGEGRLSARRV